MVTRFDEHAIKDRFAGVAFQFYTDEEIERLSVQKIVDPVAFDHLNNPTKQGLHDKALGVSPFDHKSTCPTCGMTVNQCPGHVGHIDLAAPVYNPFLMKDVYKLLKSKCFACDRLRIHPSKIQTYVVSLQLLKAGDLVTSQELKNYFLYAANALVIANEATLTNKAKLQKLKAKMDEFQPTGVKLRREDVDAIDLPNFFTKIENSINERKESYEEDLKERLREILGNSPQQLQANTSAQKRMMDLVKEIWSQVITTTCPHCKHKSPAVKRDGFTKLFVKPLQARSALVQRQAKAIQQAKERSRSKDSTLSNPEESKLEQQTTASSGAQTSSRKQSSHTEADALSESARSRAKDEEDDDNEEVDEEESSEEEYQEGGSQKFITPIEVEDHIRKLWKKEQQLLGLIYGKFDAKNSIKVDSQGYKSFF